jgi:hypothetical protein
MRLESRAPAPGSREWRVHWSLTVYPDAAEAGGCLRVPRRRLSSGRGSDPARAAEEATRRARAKIRRYCAANRLNRLGTLTYEGAGCHEPLAVRSHVGQFFKSLRCELGDRPLPYLWVPQWHPGGHGLHVHFAVGRFVRQALIRETWGRGYVHIKLLGDLPVGSGTLEEARLAARYLSRYIGKSLDGDRAPGLHRYEVAQGFQPTAVYCYGPTAEVAIGQASQLFGRAPSHVWLSSSTEGWNGPPACWVAWSS